MDKLRISSMSSVAVKKGELLKVLKKNRGKHLAFYLPARKKKGRKRHHA